MRFFRFSPICSVLLFVEKLEGRHQKDFYSDEFTETALKYFAQAQEVAKDNARIRYEVISGERMFIMDWMKHPLTEELTEQSRTELNRQLDRLAALAGESENARIAFAREIHRVGVEVESIQKGALAVVEQWLQDQNLPRAKAEKIPGGVNLRSEIWMYDGWGPRVYRWHAYAVPARVVVAVCVRRATAPISATTWKPSLN